MRTRALRWHKASCSATKWPPLTRSFPMTSKHCLFCPYYGVPDRSKYSFELFRAAFTRRKKSGDISRLTVSIDQKAPPKSTRFTVLSGSRRLQRGYNIFRWSFCLVYPPTGRSILNKTFSKIFFSTHIPPPTLLNLQLSPRNLSSATPTHTLPADRVMGLGLRRTSLDSCLISLISCFFNFRSGLVFLFVRGLRPAHFSGARFVTERWISFGSYKTDET